MHPNAQRISDFFAAFQAKDASAMHAWYGPDARFSDPVFPDLDTDRMKAMWSMFCRSTDLQIEVEAIRANDDEGTAVWRALYAFPATRRPVINAIRSSFHFRDGQVIRHTDAFNFHDWAQQALGFKGLILGWTPYLKKKVRASARLTLEDFMSRLPSAATDLSGF